MNRTWVVAGLTSIAMLSTLTGGVVAMRARRHLHLVMAFGGGVLVGAVYFDLLPEALQVAAATGWGTRAVLAVAGIGMTAFYLLDVFLVRQTGPENDRGDTVHPRLGRITALALIAHSILDGAAIGAATLLDWRTGVLVALAVVAHDSGDGLNTILLVTHGAEAGRSDVAFLLADALAPIVGGLGALLALPSAADLAVFLALASGLFLYTALSDLLAEARHRSRGAGIAVAMLTGIALVATAVRLLGH